MPNITKVVLIPTSVGKRGQLYNVQFENEIVVRNSRDPEYAAARVLSARGIEGQMVTVDLDDSPRMRFDIATAAKLTTEESSHNGLHTRKWKPFEGVEQD